MLTQSFLIDLPSEMFHSCFRICCEMHEVQCPDSNNEIEYERFRKYIDGLWKKYGNDICMYLNRHLPNEFSDIEWDNDIEVAKAVAVMYIDYCAENTYFCIDLETYWKDLMIKAIEAHAEVLFEKRWSM